MSDQSVPMLWRRIKHVYNLVGRHCRTCDTKYFPPVPLCPKCRRKSDLVDFQFSGLGKIYSYTTVNDAPTGFGDLAPYVLGMIRLDEGPLVLAQIAEAKPEDLKIGNSVQVVFRRIGDAGRAGVLRYSYKFRPLPSYATGDIIASVTGQKGVQHMKVTVNNRGRRSVQRMMGEAVNRMRRRKKKEELDEASQPD